MKLTTMKLLMNYKITALWLMLVLGCLKTVFAQQPDLRSQIESIKIGFISNKLQLTPDEAKRFWPVYDRFNADMEKTRKSMRNLVRDEMTDLQKLNESEAEKVLTDLINFKVQEAELTKKYAAEFKKVIPATKVLLLYRAEQDFKVELLRRLKDRRDKK